MLNFTYDSTKFSPVEHASDSLAVNFLFKNYDGLWSWLSAFHIRTILRCICHSQTTREAEPKDAAQKTNEFGLHS